MKLSPAELRPNHQDEKDKLDRKVMQLKDMLEGVKTKMNRAPKTKAAEAVLALGSPSVPTSRIPEEATLPELGQQEHPISSNTFGRVDKLISLKVAANTASGQPTTLVSKPHQKKKRADDALAQVNKKMKTIVELLGPSLFGELIVPRYTFGKDVIEVLEYQLLPN